MVLRKKPGQVLILVLLVVVVALAVGLSVASRNVTNLRTATQTEQSQRAFTAAEGGVEQTLTSLKDYKADPKVFQGITKDVPVGNITASVTVKGSKVYEQRIDPGNVGQIDLANPPYKGDSVTIRWAKKGDNASVPSILTTVIYGKDTYSQIRGAYGDDPGFSGTNCAANDDYTKCVKIPLAGKSDLQMLRIRPLRYPAFFQVSGDGNNDLPGQVYTITSTASTDTSGAGVTRKVQVDQTALPQLPAAFDYVLYSDTGISK